MFGRNLVTISIASAVTNWLIDKAVADKNKGRNKTWCTNFQW